MSPQTNVAQRARATSPNVRTMLNKVPEVTIYFWIIKVLATTVGETAADFHTTKREAFYWVTILFTFALGTAAGDLVSEELNLGYWKAALLFAALIGIVAVAYYVFNLNEIVAFWLAYILTRPLGASVGDYVSQARGAGGLGLGLGTTVTSVLFLLTILGVVVFLSKTRTDLPAPVRAEL